MTNQIGYIQLLETTTFVGEAQLLGRLLEIFTIDEMVEKGLMIRTKVEPRLVSPSITTTSQG